jgi:cytochrome bd ubiquinol oxidase subunit II
MMIDVLIFFIGASLLLYVVLGGSDYGAGILELLPAGTLREPQKHVINEAMGPVWEANHMWLILVVVILFVGFPAIFTTLMIALHIPMLALLLGIVVRGAVFTFRHYDAVKTDASQRVYTWLFGVSSLWTAFWLGVIVASLNRGIINLQASSFWDGYVRPWWGLYPASVGFFVICIFAFLASVYLIGETSETALKRRFTRFGALFNCLVILSGGLVFLASRYEHESLPQIFFRNPATLFVMIVATALFLGLWLVVRRQRAIITRVVAAAQVSLILLGWYLLYSPNAMVTVSGPVDFYSAAAPESALRQLVIALLVGSLFIFPSLLFLLRVFKLRDR